MRASQDSTRLEPPKLGKPKLASSLSQNKLQRRNDDNGKSGSKGARDRPNPNGAKKGGKRKGERDDHNVYAVANRLVDLLATQPDEKNITRKVRCTNETPCLSLLSFLTMELKLLLFARKERNSKQNLGASWRAT